MASLLARHPPVAPLDRLAREAEHTARSAMRGKRPELVDAAVRSALSETVFRFEPVMRINVKAHELRALELLLELGGTVREQGRMPVEISGLHR